MQDRAADVPAAEGAERYRARPVRKLRENPACELTCERSDIFGTQQTTLWLSRASLSSNSARATVSRRLPLSWTQAHGLKRTASDRCWSSFACRTRRVSCSWQYLT